MSYDTIGWTLYAQHISMHVIEGTWSWNSIWIENLNCCQCLPFGHRVAFSHRQCENLSVDWRGDSQGSLTHIAGERVIIVLTNILGKEEDKHSSKKQCKHNGNHF